MELKGRVAFGRMEAVTFGRPANEALLEEIKNYDANRVFLLASGTLNRNTDEIDKDFKNTTFMQKTIKIYDEERLFPINYDEFGFRVNYKTEKTLKTEFGIVKDMLNKWNYQIITVINILV